MYTKTKLLKTTVILGVALFFTMAAVPSSMARMHALNGTTVTKIRMNGRSASVFLVDGDSGTTGFLNVGEDVIAQTVALDFSYSTAHPTDPNFVIILQGADYVPNTAFTALSFTSTTAHMALTTPSSYFVNRCIFNLITAEYTCEPGDPVTFDLTWVRNDVGNISEKVRRIETFGPFTTSFEGEYISWTATVSGSWSGALGQITAADLSGNLVDTKGKTFIREITMKANP